MGKVCSRCDEVFYPTGKNCKLCEFCIIKTDILRRVRTKTIIKLNQVLLNIDKKIEQGALNSARALS